MVFIDAIPVLFFHATCFAKIHCPPVRGYCSGIWCWPAWTLSSKAFPIFLVGLLLPPPPAFLLFVMLSHSLRGTQWPCSQAVMLVWDVWVYAPPPPRYIWIKSLPNLNLSELWWSHFAHICARACDRLIFFWFQLEQESVSVNTFTCQPCVFILCPAYSGSPCGLSVLSPPESAESRSSPHVP